MVQKDLHERRAVEVGEFGNLANHADVPKFLDGFPVLAVLVADQDHPVHR